MRLNIGSAIAYAIALTMVAGLIYFSSQGLGNSVEELRTKRNLSIEAVMDMKDSKQRFIAYALISCLDKKGTRLLDCKNDTLTLTASAFGQGYKTTANLLLDRVSNCLTTSTCVCSASVSTCSQKRL